MTAARPTVTVDGAEQIAARLHRLADDLADVRDVNREAADVIASAARRRAPRRTGALAASIRAGAAGIDGAATVTVGVRYGVPVEARNPFWQNAIRDTETERGRLYERRVTEAVRKANR